MSEVSNANFSYLHRAFADTEHGQYLAKQTRWDHYRPADVSPQRWRELLGIDISNLGHLQLSGNLARVIIREMDKSRPGYLTDEDKVVIEVAAYTHDWPESIVGDTNYHLKSTLDDEEEKRVFERSLRAFYPDCSPEMEAIIGRAIDEVIYAHDDAGLARVFNVIERVGYVRTPLRAAEVITRNTAPECDRNMRRMIGDTFSTHIIPLIEYTYEFPPVELFLRNQNQRISQAFGLVDQEVFAALHSDEIREKFMVAKSVWSGWVDA